MTLWSAFRKLVAAVGCLYLTACGPTPYQPDAGGGQGGYSENKIDSTTWSVTFRGNPDNTVEQVFTYWLYRCAEIATREGYTHFVRVDMQVGAAAPPAGRIVGHRWGGMIFAPSHEARTPVKGGGLIFIPMYMGPSTPSSPRQSYGVIRLFKDVPEDQKAFAYNAAEVLSENEARVKGSKKAG